MSKVFFIFFQLFVLSFLSFPADDSVLVDLGLKKISIPEFSKRIEFTPWPFRNLNRDMESVKKDFLVSLIAEKILAIEGEKLRLDTIPVVKYSLINIEKMYLRDALYRNVIKKKINVSKKELDDTVEKSLYKFYIKYLESNDSTEIYNIYSLLKKGLFFDSVLVERKEYNAQKKPFEVTYGMLPAEMEKVLYTIRPNTFSKPLKSEQKFYIIKVDSIADISKSSEFNLETVIKNVQKKIKEKIETRLTKEYYNSYLAKKKSKVEEEQFINLVSKFNSLLLSKINGEIRDTIFEYTFTVNDLNYFEQDKKLLNGFLWYADTLKVTVKEFLFRLIFDETIFKDYSESYLRNYLLNKIRYYSSQDYLFMEALNQKLNLDNNIKSEIQMWKDNFLANAYSLKLQKSLKVNDDDISDLFDSLSSNIPLVDIYKVQEILVDSLGQVENILLELSKNSDFSALARKNTKRKWAVKYDGVLGYITEGMAGNIGKEVRNLAVGEVLGPIKTDSGYSVIKLLDKKKISPLENKSKEKHLSDLKEKKLRSEFDALRDSIVSVNASHLIKNLNFSKLNNINTSSVNMFVYRYFGFGGKLTAVPVLSRYNSWFELFEKMQRQNP